jgi:ABC-2 type transport system ATP-binding protein
MKTLLSVRDLRFQYGARVAVDSVSFDIQAGEVFGLLGPNGAGKTTTISCIAGLLSNWQGDMEMRGKSFRPAIESASRANLGLVPQELAIYDNLTAAENLRFFAKMGGVSKSELATRVDKLLAMAGLSERCKDLVNTFSGGMKRRLNLAAGIIHQPPFVLLDEPTVGVDPQSRNHLFDSILALRQSGTSMLYTTHYMEEAERLCDRVAIMNEGRIIAVGTPAELIATVPSENANLESVFLHLTGRKLRDE